MLTTFVEVQQVEIKSIQSLCYQLLLPVQFRPVFDIVNLRKVSQQRSTD
jgi:hypothetical protein